MAWLPIARDTCYLIVSPNPTFATQGVPHTTQAGATLHYFRIKFGDGSYTTPGRYDTCNADFYARDNNDNLEGIYRTPNKDQTQYDLRRCGKFLERMILQEITYDLPGGRATLEQIGNATGGETEWYRIWARPGNDIRDLGQLLTQLVNHFPNAQLGLVAEVPQVLVDFGVHNMNDYNNLDQDQKTEFGKALVLACQTEATAYAHGGGNIANSVVHMLAKASRALQDP